MLQQAFDRMRNFRRGERGAITVEFVVTLPILLAVLLFVQQYGETMRIRNAMDIAVRDSARFLARAPFDEATGAVPPEFICTARTIVETRMGVFGAATVPANPEGGTAAGCTGVYADAGGNLVMDESGAIVSDSLVIQADANTVVVAAAYEVNLTFARMFGTRARDVTWTVSANGQESATYTARTDTGDGQAEGQRIIMVATEIWPRTE